MHSRGRFYHYYYYYKDQDSCFVGAVNLLQIIAKALLPVAKFLILVSVLIFMHLRCSFQSSHVLCQKTVSNPIPILSLVLCLVASCQ
jgi:hypothetical protein